MTTADSGGAFLYFFCWMNSLNFPDSTTRVHPTSSLT